MAAKKQSDAEYQAEQAEQHRQIEEIFARMFESATGAPTSARRVAANASAA